MSEVEANDFEKQFLYAAKNGHLQRAERLLLDGNFDPSKDDSFILQWACEHGLAPVVSVLLKDKRVDPRCKDDVCIQLVCESGHLDVLKLLLEDGRTSPTVQLSLPFWLACQNGHTEIAKLLLEDGRIDMHTKIDNMTPLEVAVLNESYEVAQLLLHAAKTSSVVQRSLSKQSSKKTTGKDRAEDDSTRHLKQRSGSSVKEIQIRKASATSSKGRFDEYGNVPIPTSLSANMLLASFKEEGEHAKKKYASSSELSSRYKEKEENVLAEDTDSHSNKALKDNPKPSPLRKQRTKSCEKMKGSLDSIDENVEAPKKLNSNDCQKRLMEIVRKRKVENLGVFHVDLKNLLDNGVSPEAPCFNKALKLLLKPSKSSSKDAGRGTCYQYVKELLSYASAYKNLQIENDTIALFENHYSPFNHFVKNMFKMRNRESPVSLLKNYKTT